MINLRQIDLNLLTVFEALYEERSQAKAAERLGTSQPVVSNAIARLRAVVGDQLFVGRVSGVETTLKADQLYQRLHGALNEIRQQLSEKTTFDPAQSHRNFVIAVSNSGGLVYGSALLRRLRHLAPNCRLTARVVDPVSQVPDLLASQQLDLAVQYVLFDDIRLEQLVFSEEELALVVSRDHPRIQNAPTLEQCIPENFAAIYTLLDTAHDRVLDNFLDIVKALTVLEVSNPLVVMDAVRQSDFVGVVLRRVADDYAGTFGLQVYPPPVGIPRLRSYLSWAKRLDNDHGHRWLREQMKVVVEQVNAHTR